MTYEISKDELSVKINSVGAEIKSVIFKGKERSWQNNNGEWSRTSPVLFPVCGNTSVIISGKDYKMPFHGFARTSEFVCESIKQDEVTFYLRDNEHTFAIYPFKFELRITYRIDADSIIIENEIKNKGAVTMPYALGRHDSFVLDKPLENYKLCFPLDEDFLSQQCDKSGRLINLYYDFGSGRELVIPSDYLIDGQTLIFGNINSDYLTLKTVDNRPIARFFFGKVSNVLFWRPNFSQMICIEPWTALPDSADEYNIDCLKKTRLSLLKADGTEVIRFGIKMF